MSSKRPHRSHGRRRLGHAARQPSTSSKGATGTADSCEHVWATIKAGEIEFLSCLYCSARERLP
jgi:hypothetical protein